MPKTDFLENAILDHVFRGVAMPTLTDIWVALFTAAPGEAGGGTEVSTTGTAYARVLVARAGASWDAPSAGATANAIVITFPSPTADWGVVTHMAFVDAATAGNILYYEALTTPRTVNNGDVAPSFAIGALTVAET